MYKQRSMDSFVFGGFSLLPVELFCDSGVSFVFMIETWFEFSRLSTIMNFWGQFIEWLFCACVTKPTKQKYTLPYPVNIPNLDYDFQKMFPEIPSALILHSIQNRNSF